MSGCTVQVSSLAKGSGPVATLAVGVVGFNSWSSPGLEVPRCPDVGLRRLLANSISEFGCRFCGWLVRLRVSCWRSVESDAVGISGNASLWFIQCRCWSRVSSGSFCHSSTLAIRTSLNSSSRGFSLRAAGTSRCC